MISIVVPCLNADKYLANALLSILTQSYDNWECIVIDGGSTDRSCSIAENYASRSKGRIRLIRSQDKNEPDAINKAMRQVKGDILAFLDADDMYLPGAFRNVAKVFGQQPPPYWAFGKYRIIDTKGHKVQKWLSYVKGFMGKYCRTWLLNAVCYIPQPACFWRKSAWLQVGEFNTGLKYAFDYDYWLRLMQLGKPQFIDKPLACWRSHGDSVTGAEPGKLIEQTFEVQRSYTKRLHPAYYLQPFSKALSARILLNGK